MAITYILGAGYVGRHLMAADPDARGTRRRAETVGSREVCFNLEKPETWERLDLAGRHVVWAFPATPLETVEQFHAAQLRETASLIVLGSTSAYKVPHPDASIDEDAELDLAQPRVAGEEWLRDKGATILNLAGIFGPDREPVRWLEKGLIKNGRKRVNLIHVADIITVIQAFAQTPRPAQRFNVSNGLAPAWKELVALFQRRGLLPPGFALPDFDPGPENKVIDSRRLHALFPGKEWLTP